MRCCTTTTILGPVLHSQTERPGGTLAPVERIAVLPKETRPGLAPGGGGAHVITELHPNNDYRRSSRLHHKSRLPRGPR